MKKTGWLILLIAAMNGVSASAAPARPNIVWITTEDNSATWLRLYDKEHGVPMPNVEKLAAHGLVFNRAFSNGAVCSVARSTLLSGCYTTRVGAQFHRKAVPVPFPDGLEAYPAYFRKAGYYTANCSKTDYNFNVDGEVWDACSKQASFRDRQPGQPFFQVWSLQDTHESRMHQLLDDRDPETLITRPSGVQLYPYHPDTPLFRKSYAHYYDKHRDDDVRIGKLIGQLEEAGVMDDTIIFYYGDHGGTLPRSKGYAYESGLRVPFVVYVPTKWQHLFPAPAGSRIDGFVSFIDFAPTVLRLAGIEVPDQMDGVPFLGKGVKLDELNRRDETFCHADRFDEKYDLVRTFRKGHFKYMRSYQPFNMDSLYNNYRYKQAAYREWHDLYVAGKLNAAQSQFFEARPAECLYDLAKDPNEVHNLAKDPQYAAQLKMMRGRLSEKVKSLPDLSFYPESYLTEVAFTNPVAFGQQHKADIAALVDVADLNLLSFAEARSGIAAALNSDDPWTRYWGLIVCSSFGKEAREFYNIAKALAGTDPEPLVRTRAAEFLGLTGQLDPIPAFQSILAECDTDIEVLLALNSATLMKTWLPELAFEFDEAAILKLAGEEKNNLDWLNRRLDYLR